MNSILYVTKETKEADYLLLQEDKKAHLLDERYDPTFVRRLPWNERPEFVIIQDKEKVKITYLPLIISLEFHNFPRELGLIQKIEFLRLSAISGHFRPGASFRSSGINSFLIKSKKVAQITDKIDCVYEVDTESGITLQTVASGLIHEMRNFPSFPIKIWNLMLQDRNDSVTLIGRNLISEDNEGGIQGLDLNGSTFLGSHDLIELLEVDTTPFSWWDIIDKWRQEAAIQLSSL